MLKDPKEVVNVRNCKKTRKGDWTKVPKLNKITSAEGQQCFAQERGRKRK